MEFEIQLVRSSGQLDFEVVLAAAGCTVYLYAVNEENAVVIRALRERYVGIFLEFDGLCESCGEVIAVGGRVRAPVASSTATRIKGIPALSCEIFAPVLVVV